MAIPSVTENIRDGGLNQTTPASMMAIVIGPADAGTSNDLTLFSDVNSLKDAHGEGVGVEHAASILARGGRPVGYVRSGASVAGTIARITGVFTEDGTAGTVTQPTTDGNVTVDAAALTFGSDIEITIETGGALATMEFSYTIDAVASGEGTILSVVSGIHTLIDGSIITFSAATYVGSETASWTTTQGGPVVTATGTPNYDTTTRVEILSGGVLGTATFKYSADGYVGDTVSERTYSETLIVPAGGTYAVPGMGFSIVFASGTYFLGDVYTVPTTAAGLNATDLTNAFAGINAEQPYRYFVVATGDGAGDSTAHALLAVALQSQLDVLANLSIYRRGMVATGGTDSTDAAAAYTAFSAVTGNRLLCMFGKVRRATTKPLSGFAFPVVHSVDPVAARASRSLASTDLKRPLSGSLSEVIKTFHDELASPTGLDDIKVSTLRKWQGRQAAIYITQGRLKSSVGSDFKLWPHGIVLDIGCETAHDKLIDAVGRMLRTRTVNVGGNDYPGVIDPRDAGPLNDGVTAVLAAQLVTPTNAEGTQGHVQEISFRVSDTHNFLSTGVIQAALSIKPFGYADAVVTDVGFVVEIPEEA